MNLFDEVEKAGIPYANHESDLYIPVNEETRKLIAAYEFKRSVKIFKSNIDGKAWYDVPFAFAPWWIAKCGRA